MGARDLGDLGGRALLELGCGHGAIIRALATTFPRGNFCGLDFSPGQLELARRETGHLANVRYLLWDARLGLPDGLAPFDDLLSVYGALDFFADPSSMLSAFLAGLRPGGICCILTSVELVYDATVRHPRLDVWRNETVGSHWFVRAGLTS